MSKSTIAPTNTQHDPIAMPSSTDVANEIEQATEAPAIPHANAQRGLPIAPHANRSLSHMQARQIAQLQRSSGNRAVTRMIQAQHQKSANAPAPIAQPVATPTAEATEAIAKQPRTRGRAYVGIPRIQRLEAQHHEHVERGALTAPGAGGGAGFSDAEASATYFGNWSRDMNQALGNNPITKALGKELVFEIINVLAIQKFGRQLNPKDFGVYSPREHMDNPAGQINADMLKKDQERTFSQFKEKPNEPEDISSEAAVKKMFVVNDAGLPAYLGRSIQYVEEEFSTAADQGRTADGLMHFGNGLHTVEDLFAHSNFIEIAVGQLINDDKLKLKLNLDADLSKEMDQRKKQGLDPVETLAGKTAGPKARPILMTGSFVADDTLISLAEAVTAFMNDFEPFSPSNAQRNQQAMTMILGRYESLAKTGDAGKIVIPFIETMGSMLSTKLAEAADKKVSGEQPKEDASFLDKAISKVRGAAGTVVGGAVSLGGKLLQNDWVKEHIASAINGFGQLPLTEIYAFILDKTGKIKNFFIQTDLKLQQVPGYNLIKSFIKEQLEALREKLKPVITAAVKFVGSLIQKSFSEAEVEKTNIQQQINKLIESKVKDPAARGQLNNAATPEAKLALLANAEWSSRAQLSPDDMERLRQMIQSPEYIKAGPSHSQIAKDHADSPFFGTAVVLAGLIDQQMRDKMIDVWASEGDKNTQKDDKLKKNYADEIPPDIAARLPPPGTPENQMTQDQRLAIREAQKKAPHFKEFKRRQEGETMLKEGALPEGEEQHGGEAAYNAIVTGIRVLGKEILALPATMRTLATRMETLAPDIAATLIQIADELPKGIEQLADEIEAAQSADAISKLAAKLRKLAQEKVGLISRAQTVLRRAASLADKADPAMDDLAGAIRVLAKQLEPMTPVITAQLSKAADFLEKRGDLKLRSEQQIQQVHTMAPVQTGTWDAEFAKSAGRAQAGQAMSPQRKALFDFVHQIMNHPYESTWWQEPLLNWCNQNKDRLEAYIRARNSGDMHHHDH